MQKNENQKELGKTLCWATGAVFAIIGMIGGCADGDTLLALFSALGFGVAATSAILSYSNIAAD